MIKNIFRKLFNNKVDALGLSVFRMAYALILFFEIAQLFRFKKLIYDVEPFRYAGDINVAYIFIVWFVIVGMLFFGLFTRFAVIVNYLFGVIIFSSASKFEYHVFYAYVGINFLLLFMPLSRVFSIDSLIRKLKFTNIGRPFKPDRNVLELNYLVVVFVAIGLVYFDSVFRKLASPMWTDGLGMWLPSSLPMMVWNDTSVILNQEWLVKFLGYLVIVFEAVFIFLFWFKKFRLPFFFLGLFFHLGILIAYPIPWFALTAVVVYILLVPPSFWTSISQKFKSKVTSYTFYYDAECPLCNKVIVAIGHFDVFKKIDCKTVQAHAIHDIALSNISEIDLLINIHGVDKSGNVFVGYDAYIKLMQHLIYFYPLAIFLKLPGISTIGRKIYRYIAGNRLTERCTAENCHMPEFAEPMAETDDFLVTGWNRLKLTKSFYKWLLILFTVFQLIIISFSPIFPESYKTSLPGKILMKYNEITRMPLKKAFGITSHPVFMYDIHFDDYNHIFKLVCNENNKTVPLLDNNGMVTNSYANGALWVNYTFRVSARLLNKADFESGMLRYLRYFEKENYLSNSSYTIYVKEIESTDHWQKDFLRKQMKKPWLPSGNCILTKNTSEFEWTEKMNAVFEADSKKK